MAIWGTSYHQSEQSKVSDAEKNIETLICWNTDPLCKTFLDSERNIPELLVLNTNASMKGVARKFFCYTADTTCVVHWCSLHEFSMLKLSMSSLRVHF